MSLSVYFPILTSLSLCNSFFYIMVKLASTRGNLVSSKHIRDTHCQYVETTDVFKQKKTDEDTEQKQDKEGDEKKEGKDEKEKPKKKVSWVIYCPAA